MTELLGLRGYQRDAIKAVEAAWRKGKRPAVVSATGTGKTVTFSHLIEQNTSAGFRALVLVHRDELVNQAVGKLREVGTGMRVGIIKGQRNDTDADVIVASVQTLRSDSRLAALSDSTARHGAVGLIVVDECHHAAAPSYRKIIDFWPGALLVGFTATLVRDDRKELPFDEVALQYDVLDAINDGWLCDVSGRLVTVDGMSLSEVAARAGDFAAGSLADTLMSSQAQNYVVNAYTEHARHMPGIVFTPNVETAHAFTAAFADAGYSVSAVWGEMPPEERSLVLKRFAAGETQVLVNCMVLTEGFDAPRAQCAVIARPTMSASLYIQMVGRVLRPFPGKDKALVLDVVGASQEHRLATLADLSSRRVSEVRPGETLRDAVAREIRNRNPNLSGYVLKSEEVDLFHRSRSTWLQTYGGVWFLPVPNGLVFIWPGNGADRYRVGIRPLHRPGGRWVREDLDLEYAMAWGERAAERYVDAWKNAQDVTAWTNSRRASWRRKPASFPAARYARSLGLDLDPMASAGDVSDAINIRLASTALDRNT